MTAPDWTYPSAPEPITVMAPPTVTLPVTDNSFTPKLLSPSTVIAPWLLIEPFSVLSIWIPADFSPSTVIAPVLEIVALSVPPDAP